MLLGGAGIDHEFQPETRTGRRQRRRQGGVAALAAAVFVALTVNSAGAATIELWHAMTGELGR